MKFNLRVKLIVGIVILAIVCCSFIAILHYMQLKEQTEKENKLIFNRIEDTVKDSLGTVEKAYQILDHNRAEKMKENTKMLLDMYKENPNFDEWDFQSLHEKFGMHIYIINDENTITYSSFQDDIGLNFSECCGRLATVLDHRRATGEFYHDAIDTERKTGDLKKYSYMATPDKKYIIELSYSLSQNDVFNAFNFFNTINKIKDLYPYIYEINILNIGGLTLGKSASERTLTLEEREAFESTLKSRETTEMKNYWNGEPATFRYIYYNSEFERDYTQNKVIEIIYDEDLWNANLVQYKKMFLIQLFIIVAFVLLLSFVIARPMYLAYHDRLTGLANRSAFDDLLSSINTKKGMKSALFMIDLDYFKKVNDELGHHLGDALLKNVADAIRTSIPKNGIAYRYGGDEFIVFLNSTTTEEAENLAQTIITKINDLVQQDENIKNLGVSASIGISFYPDDGDDKFLLYEKADVALYDAKEKGKGQYSVFHRDIPTQHF